MDVCVYERSRERERSLATNFCPCLPVFLPLPLTCLDRIGPQGKMPPKHHTITQATYRGTRALLQVALPLYLECLCLGCHLCRQRTSNQPCTPHHSQLGGLHLLPGLFFLHLRLRLTRFHLFRFRPRLLPRHPCRPRPRPAGRQRRIGVRRRRQRLCRRQRRWGLDDTVPYGSCPRIRPSSLYNRHSQHPDAPGDGRAVEGPFLPVSCCVCARACGCGCGDMFAGVRGAGGGS